MKTIDLKPYEKILIGIVLLLFGAQLLPIFTEKEALFALATWILALSYLIGSYWLLNPKDPKKYFIPIVAGVAFAASLSVLPFLIRIKTDTIFKILPLINAGLFLGLAIYLIIKRNEKDIVKHHKGIIMRSAIILAVVGFYSYTPVSFKPYRDILIALNNDNELLVANMQVFDYMEEVEDALESGNCVLAIENAEKAVAAGKTWLGISTSEDDILQKVEAAPNTLESDSTILSPGLKSAKSQLSRISGTFTNLYKAYKCKADKYYKSGKYEQALTYYQKADTALNACDHHFEHWYVEQAFSLNLIALCYKKLNNYEYADSLFVEAIEKFQAIKNTTDRDLALLYVNLAKSMAEQLQFGYSNLLYKTSIEILQKDTTHKDYKKDLIESYHSLIKNHLQSDSLDQARFFLEETFKLVDKTSVDFCFTNMYYGLYFYKLSRYSKADEVFTVCLDCFKKLLEPTNQNIAESHLALATVKIALAEYDLAMDNLNLGIELTIKNHGKNSVKYADHLKVSAHLNKELGNYEKSEKEYYQVLETYSRELGARNRKLPEILSGLADLDITLTKFSKAKASSDSSLSIANHFTDIESPFMTDLINNAAHVNYSIGLYDVSESLYYKSIKINKNYGSQTTAQTAIALNGLGLVMTAKNNYKTADSLFIQSLKLHKEIFHENHPFTALVYLNYANLKIEENKLNQAKDMLAKSREINKNFFNQAHDIFADIYLAYGNLSAKEKRFEQARDYYQKALETYLGKFDEGHLRVKLMREKLKE